MLIDPRGLIGDEVTIYGDVRYDIAKLGHSIWGRYDQIMAEGLRAGGLGANFELEIPVDRRRGWLEEMFFAGNVAGVSFNSPEIKAAIISLFLSMVPLHAEDESRQRTLLANGLRLFNELNS
mgnify:CR=1 FL=1